MGLGNAGAKGLHGGCGALEIGGMVAGDESEYMTREEAIRIHTRNGAWTLRLEDVTGSIEVGKSADFIVLGHNLLDIPVTDIHKTEVKKTIFNGPVVYERSE